jgi:hypothetical protein
MIRVVLFLILYSSTHMYCQEVARTWFLPPSTRVDFNQGFPVVTKEKNNYMGYLEGHSVINSDSNNVLFYTNGNEIWDKNHRLIDGGGKFLGEILIGVNQTIVIKSKEKNKYFVLALNDSKLESKGELFYRTVILDDLNNKLQVLPINNPIKLGENFLQSMIAIDHPCGGHWLVLNERQSNKKICLHFYEGQILKRTESNIGSVPLSRLNSFSHSPNQGILTFMNANNFFEIFKFEPNSGVISNLLTIKRDNGYIGSFSPNGRFFYFLGGNGIIQYDFAQYNIDSIQLSRYEDIFPKTERDDTMNGIGLSSIQKGPFNKLYFSGSGQIYSRGVIHNPDEKGAACNFVPRAIISTEKFYARQIPTELVLPNPIIEQVLPTDTTICKFTTLKIQPTITFDSLRWGDGSTNKDLTITNSGRYNVELYKNGCTYRDTFFLSNNSTVKIQNISLCPNETFEYKNKKYKLGTAIIDTAYGQVCDTFISIKFTPRANVQKNSSVSICPNTTFQAPDGKSYSIGDTIASTIKSTSGSCDTLSKLSITAKSIADVKFSGQTQVCFGDSTEITLDKYQNYQWSNGSTNQKTRLKKGNHTVTITDAQGCKVQKTITITELPKWAVTIKDTAILQPDQDLILDISGDSKRATAYKVNPKEDGIVVIEDKLLISELVENGTYKIIFTDKNGCVDSQSIIIKKLEIADDQRYANVIMKNASSPSNRIWKVNIKKGSTLQSLSIYNRWGNKVYTSTDPDIPWDAKDTTPDVYVFRVETKDKSGKLSVQIGSILVAD